MIGSLVTKIVKLFPDDRNTVFKTLLIFQTKRKSTLASLFLKVKNHLVGSLISKTYCVKLQWNYDRIAAA